MGNATNGTKKEDTCYRCFEVDSCEAGLYIGAQFLCSGCAEPRQDTIHETANSWVALGRKLVWTDKGRKFIGVRSIVVRIGDYELSLTKDAAHMLAQEIHDAFKNDAQSTDSWTGKEV